MALSRGHQSLWRALSDQDDTIDCKGQGMSTLDWIGKQAVVSHHQDLAYWFIHCDSELSAGDPEAGNFLVQGDNLDHIFS